MSLKIKLVLLIFGIMIIAKDVTADVTFDKAVQSIKNLRTNANNEANRCAVAASKKFYTIPSFGLQSYMKDMSNCITVYNQRLSETVANCSQYGKNPHMNFIKFCNS